MEKKKIVFLYTELASYFLSCLQNLSSRPGVEIHVVNWPVNKEAPFHFSFPETVHFYKRENYQEKELLQLVSDIKPDLIYCSGWVDKAYLKVCRQFRNQIPVVVGFDNQWVGSVKQQLAALLSKFRIHPYFSHCWVPGPRQRTFARKLGFPEAHILEGFYTCDVPYFRQQYEKNLSGKQVEFPKRLLYVGRYVESKGVNELWKAFREVNEEFDQGWELWCCGTGDIQPPAIRGVKHLGFVQPDKLTSIISQTGVLVLPSHFEPWGVVIQEFAVAGFPIICTDKVGAADQFLKNGINGYLYPSGDIAALKTGLKRIMNSTSDQLFEMGNKSAAFGLTNSPDIWSSKLLVLLK